MNNIENNFKKNFAKNIKELRILQGLSQEQLSELIGVSPKTLSYWENGHNTISLNKIPVLANALGVPIFRLFIFENAINNADNFAQLIEALGVKERKILLEILKLLKSYQ